MTTKQFIAMIGEAETAGAKTDGARLCAIGDDGLACGWYQQHWAWRVDHWPAWAWSLLRVLDSIGLEHFCAEHRGETAAALAARYNLGHLALDPEYEARCRAALAPLGLPAGALDTVVKD